MGDSHAVSHDQLLESSSSARKELRVGVDLVEVAEVATSIEQFGDRYSRRLFTDHEIECCSGEPAAAAAGLAARFAAKEATLKVLRPMEHNPQWRSIEVRRHKSGWCGIHLSGHADALARAAGLSDIAVSLSHHGGMAIAFVAAWCRTPDSRNDPDYQTHERSC